MRDVVRERWLEFTEPLEGGVPCLYNDRRGLTTIAYGDLCNTPSEAAALDMVHPDGTPATAAEKIAAWHVVHDDKVAAVLGWRYAATLTKLRLTRASMTALALAKLDSNDRILRGRLPAWESYPGCAQMALHSLAWACGAEAHFPKLFADVAAGDWSGAAVEIRMNEWTPEGVHNVGLVPRNKANRILMLNAAIVDTEEVDWTNDPTDVPTLDDPA